MRRSLCLFLLSLLLIGSGCQTNPLPSVTPIATSDVTRSTLPVWTPVDLGVEKLTVDSLALYRFSSSTGRWHWAYDQKQPKRISDWRTQFPDARLIVNGVYFLEDFSPAGYLKIEGKRIGQKRFDDDKSGMIDLSGDPRIINTKRDAFDPKLLSTVGQSYPFLITDGKQDIKKDSGLIARRSFIGTDTVGRTYVGILNAQKSLFALASLLTTLNIDWKEVLNLDGGPSTGISARFEHDQQQIDSYVLVPVVLLVDN